MMKQIDTILAVDFEYSRGNNVKNIIRGCMEKWGNINRDNKVVYRDLWVSEIFEDKNISLNQKLVNWLCVYVFGRRT